MMKARIARPMKAARPTNGPIFSIRSSMAGPEI
jgi:hypothetical protein